MLAENHDPGS